MTTHVLSEMSLENQNKYDTPALSLRARLFRIILWMLGPWSGVESCSAFHRSIVRARKKPVAQPTAKMRRKFVITERNLSGYKIVHLGQKQAAAGCILLLHGGAYVHEAVKEHWKFAARLAEASACNVLVPLYPLAPEHNVEQTMAFMLEVYRELSAGANFPLFVVGDSAGGGLALALLQEARQQGLTMATGLVLISPWLDASMSAPEQLQIEKIDPALRRAGVIEAARMYVAGKSVLHPWISPLFGSLDGIPPTLMFAGDTDILVTDARRFAARASQEGLALDYCEYPGLFHDWPLAPIPEAQIALQWIVEFLLRCGG